MDDLLNLWTNYTAEFSTVQKVIIALVLTFIVCAALLAVVLLFMEMAQ